MRAKSFFRGNAVQRRKQHDPPPPGIGYFYSLPIEEQQALVEFARCTVREQRRVDRADSEEDAAYRRAKIKSNSEEELAALIMEFGYGLSFFDRWCKRGVRTVGAVTAELAKLKDNEQACPSSLHFSSSYS